MNTKVQQILELKKRKRAVIMAHYYVSDEVQEIADYIGDSYYLSEMATKIDADIIVLCGVKFMGESAKILNPKKKVLLPDCEADCPMAHMASVDKIREIRAKYEDVAVVCYVNSTAELKAESDVCVTSANALKIVSALPNKNIFFIPDKNLARYISDQFPDKNFIFNDGCCHVHNAITVKQIMDVKADRPNAKVLVHPECSPEVTALADYIGSTSGIIKYVTESTEKEFVISTEIGVIHELKKRNPDKCFYVVGNAKNACTESFLQSDLCREEMSDMPICHNMKKITLDKILHVLETEDTLVEMNEELISAAYRPMLRMLELAK